MINSLDHLIIAVDDLQTAEKNYEIIFGSSPVWKGSHTELGTSNSLFNFENTYFELLAATSEGLGAELVKNHISQKGEGLLGFALGTNSLDACRSKIHKFGYQLPDISVGEGVNNQGGKKRTWINQFLPIELTRGLFSFIIQHKEGLIPSIDSYKGSEIHLLDHVVVKTNDPDGFIKIYKDVFGIRLALDSFIEAWKKRILFFRVNKTTIEVVEEKNSDSEANDSLWGLAWEVKDINSTRKRLLSQKVEISEIKKGIKENTLVATINSHTHNIPTLIIQNTISEG
tara:strand:+ start:3387 stop:4241 length:855 start_codon:yes stop_codon:yes gene_type:complete